LSQHRLCPLSGMFRGLMALRKIITVCIKLLRRICRPLFHTFPPFMSTIYPQLPFLLRCLHLPILDLGRRILGILDLTFLVNIRLTAMTSLGPVQLTDRPCNNWLTITGRMIIGRVIKAIFPSMAAIGMGTAIIIIIVGWVLLINLTLHPLKASRRRLLQWGITHIMGPRGCLPHIWQARHSGTLSHRRTKMPEGRSSVSIVHFIVLRRRTSR